MHLVIYFQKRVRPLIFKLHVIAPVLLALLMIFLLALLIYSGFKNRALTAATLALTAKKARTAGKVLEADQQIFRLEERIRYAEEHPTTPEVLFETLNKTFASRAPDTIFPNFSAEYRRLSGKTVYAIQLASLKSRDAAASVAGNYRSIIPMTIEIEEADLPSGRWYRVIVTGFESARKAENYALELKSNGKITDYVIQKINFPYSGTVTGETNSSQN